MSITLKDIAQQAGVSQMTVSRILNGKTQGQVSEEVISRVRSIAAELKYRSNRTDRKLNCLLSQDAQDAELPKVTVLTPAPDFLEMPGRSARILNEVLPGIFQAAAEAGGMVEILPVSKANDPNKIEWPWLKTFGSGSRILALSPWFMVPLAELSRRGCRVALIQGEEFWRNMTLRFADEWAIFTYRNRLGYETLTEHLLGQGLSRIALTVYREYMDEPEYPSITGVSNILEKYGNSYRNYIVMSEADYRPEEFARAYRENPFDALIFLQAEGVSWNYGNSLQANLGVPEDVKIVYAYDNQDSLRFSPRLSGMSYPRREMAVDAVKLLLSDDFSPGERFCPGAFIERN